MNPQNISATTVLCKDASCACGTSLPLHNDTEYLFCCLPDTNRPCVVYDARDGVKAWRLILQPDTGLNTTRITCVSDPWDTDSASMPKLAAFVDARHRLYCKEWFMWAHLKTIRARPFYMHLLCCLWAVTLQSWTSRAAQLQPQVRSHGKHPGDMGRSY